MFSKRRSTSGDSTNSQDAVVSLVSALLSRCRPVAIIWRITKIVLSTLYRSSNWALTHVFKKAGEYPPPLAHGNSAPSVMFPLAAILIGASLNNSSPTVEGLGRFKANTVSVSCGTRLDHFDIKAPARFGSARCQVAIHDHDLVPAIAETHAGADRAFWNLNGLAFCDDQKPCEFSTDGETFAWHNGVDMNIVFASCGFPTPIGSRCDSAGFPHLLQRRC